MCRGAFQCVNDLSLLGIEQPFLSVRAHLADGGSAVLRKERREVDFFSVSVGQQHGNAVVARMIGIVDDAR